MKIPLKKTSHSISVGELFYPQGDYCLPGWDFLFSTSFYMKSWGFDQRLYLFICGIFCVWDDTFSFKYFSIYESDMYIYKTSLIYLYHLLYIYF